MKHTVWNSVLPISVCMADGEAHVFGDRVYLFGSHDTPGGESFCLEDYEFLSAPLNRLRHCCKSPGRWGQMPPCSAMIC